MRKNFENRTPIINDNLISLDEFKNLSIFSNLKINDNEPINDLNNLFIEVWNKENIDNVILSKLLELYFNNLHNHFINLRKLYIEKNLNDTDSFLDKIKKENSRFIRKYKHKLCNYVSITLLEYKTMLLIDGCIDENIYDLLEFVMLVFYLSIIKKDSDFMILNALLIDYITMLLNNKSTPHGLLWMISDLINKKIEIKNDENKTVICDAKAMKHFRGDDMSTYINIFKLETIGSRDIDEPLKLLNKTLELLDFLMNNFLNTKEDLANLESVMEIIHKE